MVTSGPFQVEISSFIYLYSFPSSFINTSLENGNKKRNLVLGVCFVFPIYSNSKLNNSQKVTSKGEEISIELNNS